MTALLDFGAYRKFSRWRSTTVAYAISAVPWLVLVVVTTGWRAPVVLLVFAFFAGLTVASARRAAHWSDEIARINRAFEDGQRTRAPWRQTWGAMHEPVLIQWHEVGDRTRWDASDPRRWA